MVNKLYKMPFKVLGDLRQKKSEALCFNFYHKVRYFYFKELTILDPGIFIKKSIRTKVVLFLVSSKNKQTINFLGIFKTKKKT